MNLYEKALQSLEKAIEIAPEWSWAWNNYGNALSGLGRNEEAINSYLKSNECEPGYAYPFYNLGILYHNEGEYKKAIEYYQKSLEINPRQSGCYNNLAMALGKLDRNTEAIEVFTKGLEVYPRNGNLYGNRGKEYYTQGKYLEAVADLTKAVDLKPGNAYNHKYLGMSLYFLKRYSESEKHLLLAIDLDPSYASTLENMLGSITLSKSYLYVNLLWGDVPQEGVDVTFIGLPNYSAKYISDSQGSVKILKSILTAEKKYLLYDGDYQNPDKTWEFSNTGFLYNGNMNEVVLQIMKKMTFLYPGDEEEISNGSPLLKWDNPEGATSYTLTVSSKRGELNDKVMSYVEILKLENLTTPEYQIQQTLTPEMYMVSVTAYSEDGIPLYYASGKFTVTEGNI